MDNERPDWWNAPRLLFQHVRRIPYYVERALKLEGHSTVVWENPLGEDEEGFKPRDILERTRFDTHHGVIMGEDFDLDEDHEYARAAVDFFRNERKCHARVAGQIAYKYKRISSQAGWLKYRGPYRISEFIAKLKSVDVRDNVKKVKAYFGYF